MNTEETSPTSKPFVQSYLQSGFFISTVCRESSALVSPPIWYYETLVWNWSPSEKKLGKLLGNFNGGASSDLAILAHCETVKALQIGPEEFLA